MGKRTDIGDWIVGCWFMLFALSVIIAIIIMLYKLVRFIEHLLK